MIENSLDVNIPDNDLISFREFEAGYPVQVRVTVPSKEEIEYNKGKIVKVSHLSHRAVGKIVSEPIMVREKKDEGVKVLSIIIEKLRG